MPFIRTCLKRVCLSDGAYSGTPKTLRYFSINAGIVVLALFLLHSATRAETELSVSLTPSKNTYSVGDTVLLALDFNIPNKHHLYGNPLGPGIGKPLKIMVEDVKGMEWVDVRKPEARKFKPDMSDWVWAYEKRALFFVRGVVKKQINEDIKGTVRISGLVCHTACLPIEKKVPFAFSISSSSSETIFEDNKNLRKAYSDNHGSMELSSDRFGSSMGKLDAPSLFGNENIEKSSNISSNVAPIQWNYTPSENKVKFNVGLAIFFGFLAGLILNVMPCVLPVLGIKILSFSQAQEEGSHKSAIIRSLIFSAGMISVFMILASLASFANFSWGEQFQNPTFLVGIIVLITIFALGMFDVFTIMVPGSLTRLESKSGSGLYSDFFKGMFATVLATPCSGPFLGATLAWTLTQPSIVIFAVFASIGIGMAFPYVLFSSSKRLSKLIPKPGAWMEHFKYLMGFVLIGVALYLMFGLPKDMILSTVGLCIFLAFAVTLYGRFVPWGSSVKRKMVVGIMGLAIAASGLYVNFGLIYPIISEESVATVEEKDAGTWQEFSPELLQKAHEEGRPVIVNFTASWCLNCQFNKVRVLHSKEVNDLIKEKDILAIKADLTQPDPQIKSLLNHLGSRSVPFMAVFPGDQPYNPIIMRDLLKKKQVIKTLEQVQSSQQVTRSE